MHHRRRSRQLRTPSDRSPIRFAGLALAIGFACATGSTSQPDGAQPPPANAANEVAATSADPELPDVGPDGEAEDAAQAPAVTPAPTPTPGGDLHLPDVSAAGSKRGERPGPGRGWSDEDLARIRKVQPIVRAAADEFGVDVNLVNGLIWVESKFERRARGPAGAQGYMQIMPRTAKGLARRLDERARPWDAKWNIRAGTLALSRNLDRFDGDEILALAGYNRGTGTVLGWQKRGEAVPERTYAYAQRVLRAREWFVAASRMGLLEPKAPGSTAVAFRVTVGQPSQP